MMHRLLAPIALALSLLGLSAAAAQVPDMSPVPDPASIHLAGAGAGNYDVSVDDNRLTAPTYVQPPEVDDGLDISTGGPLVFAAPPKPMFDGDAEEQGAFRFLCSAGPNRTDDPVLYYAKVGMSHLHQFFGNLLTNAFSTYFSLRTTGQSSCINILNRSAYWQVAMRNAFGWAINPDHVVVYYKRVPAISGRCTVRVKGVQINYCLPDIPRGLRFIFGADPISGAIEGGYPEFVCIPPSSTGRQTTRARYLNQIKAVCQVGDQLGAFIQGPSCWNGKDADSANHRSHMADPTGDGKTTPLCPASHPFILPTYSADALYNVDETMPGWGISSDYMANGGRGCDAGKEGCTLHMDFFPAWNNKISREWIKYCLEEWRSCSQGYLGDARQMGQDSTLPPKLPYDKNPMPMATAAGGAHIMHRNM